MKEAHGKWHLVRKGATEDHYHRGSHKNADKRSVLRGLQGCGDLGKQAAPKGSDRPPLLPQVVPTVPCRPTEAPTSPSTQRRSRRSSFTFKSSEPLADSWSQDTGKQPTGMRGKLPIWWANGRKWMDGGCSDFLNKIALRTCVFPCPLEPALSLLSYHRQ